MAAVRTACVGDPPAGRCTTSLLPHLCPRHHCHTSVHVTAATPLSTSPLPHLCPRHHCHTAIHVTTATPLSSHCQILAGNKSQTRAGNVLLHSSILVYLISLLSHPNYRIICNNGTLLFLLPKLCSKAHRGDTGTK